VSESLPSGLPSTVRDEEDLARFLFSRRDLSGHIVKHGVFMPRHGETSVFRHGKAPGETLWELGRLAAGGRSLRGAAMFKARSVRAAALDVNPDEPPPRHAVIVGWATISSHPELARSQDKEKAMKLAESAEAIRYTS